MIIFYFLVQICIHALKHDVLFSVGKSRVTIKFGVTNVAVATSFDLPINAVKKLGRGKYG